MSNSLDPCQTQHFVGPDLVQTVCKGYPQMTLVGTGVFKERKNAHTLLLIYGPRREKTCPRRFRQSEFQTSLLSYRD